MGGAFVAVADDGSAAYWNPAGLIQLESPEVTLSCSIAGWADGGTNYDLFACYSVPEERSGAGAISYVRTGLLLDGPLGGVELPGAWYTYSYSTRVRGGVRPLFWGVNLRYESYAPAASSDEAGPRAWAAGLDLGLLYFPAYPSNRVALGLLAQDLVGSHLVWDTGATTQRPPNLRPGIAFRPDGRTCLSAEVYDLTSAYGSPTLRIGLEREIGRGLAVRLGLMGLADRSEAAAPDRPPMPGACPPGVPNAAITWGVGWSWGSLTLDYCYLGRSLNGGPGLGGVHEMGVTLRM